MTASAYPQQRKRVLRQHRPFFSATPRSRVEGSDGIGAPLRVIGCGFGTGRRSMGTERVLYLPDTSTQSHQVWIERRNDMKINRNIRRYRRTTKTRDVERDREDSAPLGHSLIFPTYVFLSRNRYLYLPNPARWLPVSCNVGAFRWKQLRSELKTSVQDNILRYQQTDAWTTAVEYLIEQFYSVTGTDWYFFAQRVKMPTWWAS